MNPGILSTLFLVYPSRVAADEPMRCRCGYEKTDPHVRPEKEYTFWGQLAFGLMYTPVPKVIRYRCGICKGVVGTIDDPELMQRFRYREPRVDER